ncbi:MAG TPA: hypothetical protein VGD81_02705, partial [Opitutaceae bacterium]
MASPTAFGIDSAYDAREGRDRVRAAEASGDPYAIAFVAAYKTPEGDGLETVLELWNASPDLQVVLCIASATYTLDEILVRLGESDRLMILKKPFAPVVARQLVNVLTEKWRLLRNGRAHAREMEQRVRARTLELENANLALGSLNTALQSEIERRALIEADLQRAKAAAEAADAAKSAFLANMSH